MPDNHCQSCDMPFSKDPHSGGSDADGSKSVLYCSLCYENGEFFYKGSDATEFQAFVMEKMVEEGWWRPVAWLLTRRIPKLKRWAGEG